jgi:fluoroquinolone transport system ATP-binding protein
LISVRDLRFTYAGGRGETLHGFSFDVGAGEIFGFLGPSGAGKSTTQRILTGVLAGYAGVVEIFGRRLEEHGRRYYERIGVSFEVPNVYGRLSGRENLEFFASLYETPAADPLELLSLVGLGDVADERAASYSKGMRMRLNFCRALLCSPELLFLDEPTSRQDPENARRLRAIIRAQRDAGRTIFLTTHDMAVAAELCDRVGFIVDGRVVAVESPRSLMLRHGRRRVRVEHAHDDGLQSSEFALDGIADDVGFLELLRSGRIETIHTLEATLEDVFLAVTGRALT